MNKNTINRNHILFLNLFNILTLSFIFQNLSILKYVITNEKKLKIKEVCEKNLHKKC